MDTDRDKDLWEKFTGREEIFNGKVIKLSVDKVLLPNGKPAQRELVRHPGAVLILPVLPDGRLVFVRQYRYAVGKVLYELPAGKLDAGENPDDCALRELTEETGYVAGKLEKLSSIIVTPGFCDEVIHIYKANELVLKQQNLDEDEFVEVCLFNSKEVMAMVKNGTLCDAKTLCAILLAGIGNE